MSRSRLFLAACALATTLLPVPAGGASSPESASASATRVFTIRYRNVDDVYLLISPLLGPSGSIRTQPRQRTLTVADAPETLLVVAPARAGSDIPPRAVSVSLRLIPASTGAAGTSPPPPPVPRLIQQLNASTTR